MAYESLLPVDGLANKGPYEGDSHDLRFSLRITQGLACGGDCAGCEAIHTIGPPSCLTPRRTSKARPN